MWGKSSDLVHRYRSHVSLKVNKRYKGVKGDWIRYLAWHGLKPELHILKTNVSCDDATLWEYYYCKLFSCCPLTNTGFIFKETCQMTLDL